MTNFTKNKTQKLFALLAVANMIAFANATTTMTLLKNNGSLDQYYVPADSSSSELASTSAATAESVATTASHEEETGNSVDATTSSTVNNAATTVMRTDNESESHSTTVMPADSESESRSTTVMLTDSESESHSTTVWWTPTETWGSTETTHTDVSTDASANQLSSESESADTSALEHWSHSLTTELQATTSLSTEATATPSAPSDGGVTSTLATASQDKCQTAWGQCGGAGFNGATCCQSGLTCVQANSYWARCIQASTMNSVGSTSKTTTSGGNVQIASYTSESTVYDYSTEIYDNTLTTVDSNGSKTTEVVESTSISAYAKGVSSVVEMSTSTNGAIHKSLAGLGAYALAGLALLL